MDSIKDFCGGFHEKGWKCRVAIILAILVLGFFAIGLPLLLTPGDVSPECEDTSTMSKKSRQVVLDEHNDYRSRAAKGEFKIANEDSKLKVLPPATRMPMLKYNCTLENRSLKWAYTVQCAMKHSGQGENIFAIGGHYSAEQVAETAVKAWTDEISQHGLSGLDQWARNVGHATQVLWAATESVGCGVVQCDNGNTMAVCQYHPIGNYWGKPVYKAGKTLSECGSGGRKEVKNETTGLCQLL
ncbi:hypothetical protein Aduo_013957 [Ancylostoma duodenale]